MSKARTLANLISDNAELADGQISVAEVVGAAPLASPTFTGTINSNGNTVINERLDVNKQGEAFRLRSGGASTQNYVSIGRTGEDARITMAGAANNAIQTSAAGDLVIGANNNLLLGRIGSPYINLNSSGTVLNEQGGSDKDFRVESDNQNTMFQVDASRDAVTINGGTVAADGIYNYPLSVRANTAADAIAVVGRVNDDIGELGFYESDGTTQLGNLQARVGSMRLRMLSNGGAMMFENNDSGGNLRTRQALYGTEAVFNDGSLDYDFRVESDSNTHMLFVDAGNDQVVVGDNGNYYSKFTVVGGKTRSTGVPLNQLSVYDNSAMASSTGGAITLWGNYTTGGAQAEGASIEAYKSNGTSGNYQYGMWLKTRTHGGSMDDRLFMDQAQTVFNETGADTDFRIESDSNANAFFVDAGSEIVQSSITTKLYNGTGGHSPSLVFGSETNVAKKAIFLENFYMVHQVHANEGLTIRFTDGTNTDDRNLFKNTVTVFNESSKDQDFRVETDSINDAFEIDASQDVIKFKTNVWQHAPLTGSFAGGWVTVTNLDTLSNLTSNSAAKIRVYANENGRTNVSYSEHIAVRTNGTWALQQLGEVTSGNSHGNANIQMSGTNLQIRNAASSSIGSWKVSLELFR